MEKGYKNYILNGSKLEPLNGLINEWKKSAGRIESRTPSMMTDADIDEYVNDVKRSGIDNIVLIIQKQLDEWKASRK